MVLMLIPAIPTIFLYLLYILYIYLCGGNASGGDFNENDPHGLIFLNMCSPVGRTICERLVGMVFLENCMSLRVDFEVSKELQPFPVSQPCGCVSRCELLYPYLYHSSTMPTAKMKTVSLD